MSRLALALLLLAAPVAADDDACYTTVPKAGGWYHVVLCPTTLAPGEARALYLDLEDVPGPLAFPPAFYVKALSPGASQAAYTLSQTAFSPGGSVGGYPAFVRVILRNDGATAETYKLKAIVRGRE